MFEVYQINFTNEEIREINRNDGKVEKYQLYLKTTCFPKIDAIIEAKHLYKKVSEIEASDLDEVFEIGNIGPEDKIHRLDSMHSISVGDVIVDPENKAYFVDSFGFKLVDGWR